MGPAEWFSKRKEHYRWQTDKKRIGPGISGVSPPDQIPFHPANRGTGFAPFIVPVVSGSPRYLKSSIRSFGKQRREGFTVISSDLTIPLFSTVPNPYFKEQYPCPDRYHRLNVGVMS